MTDIIEQFLSESMLIVVVALWVVGALLKRTPQVKDWMIIWILLVISVSLAFFIIGFTSMAFIQGVLATGAAVLGHQLIKQTSSRD